MKYSGPFIIFELEIGWVIVGAVHETWILIIPSKLSTCSNNCVMCIVFSLTSSVSPHTK